jgi:ferredoxin
LAYKIDESKCTNCGLCEPNCPVEAISEKGNARGIDAGTCIDCGACAGSCPFSAISEG